MFGLCNSSCAFNVGGGWVLFKYVFDLPFVEDEVILLYFLNMFTVLVDGIFLERLDVIFSEEIVDFVSVMLFIYDDCCSTFISLY